MDFLANALSVFAVLLAGFYFYYKFVIFGFWRRLNVFYEEPSVPLGHALPIMSGKISVAEYFKDVYNRHRHRGYVGLYMFYRPTLVVADPELVKIVCTSKFSSFHDRGLYCNEKLDPLTAQILLLSGQRWKDIRSKITPMFTAKKVQDMFELIKESGENVCKYLAAKVEAKERLPIKDVFDRCLIDVIVKISFGVSCNTLENGDNDISLYSKKIFASHNIFGLMFAYTPEIMYMFSMPSTEPDIRRFFSKFFRDIFEYRETNSVVRSDFVNLLMQLMKQGSATSNVDQDNNEKAANSGKNLKNLTMVEAIAQCLLVLLAGFETTATTISFCFYELTLNQEVQDKTREEIRTVLQKHGGITYRALSEMTYLQKVLSETMRKYPSISTMNRICTKAIDLESMNLHIPKGTSITIPIYGLHHDPSIYPDPEKFDPERFSEEAIASRHPYAYVPFGEGPRICIGMKLALALTKTFVASVISSYKLTPCPDTPRTAAFEPGKAIISPKDELLVNIEAV
ncbi:hypothetical protein KM043_003479 [Ampulex compressa]|nr:hypothetical protein KM043_003479 [Ampulex compressa]